MAVAALVLSLALLLAGPSAVGATVFYETLGNVYSLADISQSD